jgi:hypothetical protein
LAGMTTATSPFSMGPILGHRATWAGAYAGKAYCPEPTTESSRTVNTESSPVT